MEDLRLSWDAEGYPTEESLDKLLEVKVMNADDANELIRQIREIWWMPDWGFIWVDGGKKLILHTGGWSGNESIISHLQRNYYFWRFWRAEFAGGHYHFEIK